MTRMEGGGYINHVEARLWYKPVLSFTLSSGKVIEVRIYNKSLYHLGEIDLSTVRKRREFEKKFKELQKRYLVNQDRCIQGRQLRSGKFLYQVEKNANPPVYWLYPNLKKRIIELDGVYTRLSHKKDSGEMIDLEEYYAVKQGILIYLRMLDWYSINVAHGKIAPWIFDEGIYKRDKRNEHESDDDDVDL